MLSALLLGSWTACAESPESDPAGKSASAFESPCPQFRRASGGLPVGQDWRFHAAVGDVNGDGFLDLAAVSRKGPGPQVFVYEPDGTWRESSEGLTTGGASCGGGAVFAEMNEKKGIDLVFADHCSGLSLFYGDGKGGWKHSKTAFLDRSAGFGMNDLAIGDINLDGIPDIIAVTAFRRGIRMFLGDGTGRWKEQASNLPSVGGGFKVELADLTGDGRLDLLTSHQVTTSRAASEDWHLASPVWIQSTDGSWKQTGYFPDDFRAFDLVVAQSPQEGSREILLSGMGKKGGIHVLSWEEEKQELSGDHSVWILPIGSGHPTSGLAHADFSGDRLPDLAVGSYQLGTVQLFLAGDNGVWKECPPNTFDTRGFQASIWDLTPADINGDGKMDLIGLQGSEGNGVIHVWLQKQNSLGEFP